MNTRARAVGIALCAAILAALPLAGQQGEGGPTWISFTYVTVKPDMDAEFQDILKNHWLPASKKTDSPFIQTWRTARFGNPYMYVFVSPIESFAQFDGEPPLVKVMSGAAYTGMWTRLQGCIDEVRTVASIAREDAGYDNPGDDPPNLAVVSTVRVKPGMNEEYAALLKEAWLPHVKKLGFRAVWTSQAVFGAPGNEWSQVLAIEDFAEIDKGPPLARAMGAEEARKVEAKFESLIESREMTIAAFLPEFSYTK